MALNFNIAHSISPAPHAFHLHTLPKRTESALDPIASPSKRATSSSFENTQITADHDPISRHPSSTHTSAPLADIESSPTSHYTPENDPFQLSSKLKSPSEINLIRTNCASRQKGKGHSSLSTLGNKASGKAKRLQTFYQNQNETIERWLRPVDEHVRLAEEFDGENKLKYKIAVQGSFAANVLLAALQIYAAVSSGSLSLFTTMADAIFDPLSNITLITCHRAIKTVDSRRFPSGKARIETAGNIVFCFLMTAVSFILIVLSIMELSHGAPSTGSGTKSFHLPSIIAVAVAFTTKLTLFAYCWTLRNVYSQIRILWEDHRNDLFVNGFGLLTSIGGSKLKWYIDPLGAIILSLLISTLWLRTAYSEFQLLIGVSADTSMLQWITYICQFSLPPIPKLFSFLFLPTILTQPKTRSPPPPAMTHSPQILGLDTVRAYHSGPRIIVEVDIVMAPGETLRATHDVAEELQVKLESLPDVERAYVHIDYETSHKPEHGLKKIL